MTHTEIPNTAADLLELLHNMGENGLHIRELARLNDLSGGFCNQLGLRFTEADREHIVAELHVTQEHLQITGIVNGGVCCAIAETVGSIMGITASNGKVVVGINNNTNFIAPVSAGVITAEAKVIQPGRRTQLISVDIFHRGHLVATSIVRTMVIDEKN